MADAEQIQKRIQSPAPFSTWLGVVLLLGVFGAIAVAIIGPAPRGDTYEKQRAENRMKKLKDARDEDAKALNAYAWIDKNKGSVRIPIERAMELAVIELASKKPTKAGPIAVAEAAAPGGVAAASPAPSPSPSAQPSGTPKPTSVAGQNSNARGQPAAAVNPPPEQPKTQPGTGAPAAAAAAASPQSSAAAPASPAPASTSSPSGSPLPVRSSTPPEGRFSERSAAPSPTSTPQWKFQP